jgi:hypothetical protein
VLADGAVAGRVKVGMWFVAEDRDRAFDRSSDAENPLSERTTIRVPLLSVDVRITPQFGMQAAASVPDITRTAIVPLAGGTLNYRENFSGLGDISVLAWYRLAPRKGWNSVLTAGVSLPTGRTETPRFAPELENGSLVPMSRLQRGSGTVDPLLGVSLDRRIKFGTFFGSVATRLPLSENGTGLRTGASWEANTGLARELGTHRLTGFARIGWLHRNQDVFEGTPVLVGGGDWLYATPGLAALVGKGVNVQAEVKLPIYRALNNRQLDSRAVFQFGVSRSF